MKYDFSIIASGLDPTADDLKLRFYDGGCDDAAVAFQKGHIIVDFTREADSIEEAIASAIECARTAGATIDRVEPDPFVNLTDIATRTRLTRAAVSQYLTGNQMEHFPPPVAPVTTSMPPWDWVEVALWSCQHDRLSREAVIEAAAEDSELSYRQPQIQQELRQGVKAYEAKLA
jgi:hypothetical protein